MPARPAPVRDAAPTAAGPSTGLLMGPASPSPTDAPPVVVNESEAEHNVEGRSSEEKANLRNAATFGVFGALVLLGFVAAALYLAVRQKRARRGAAAKFAPPPHLAAARPPLPSYNGTAAGWWMTVMEVNRGRNDRQTTPGTVPNGANSPQHVLGPRPRLNECLADEVGNRSGSFVSDGTPGGEDGGRTKTVLLPPLPNYDGGGLR